MYKLLNEAEISGILIFLLDKLDTRFCETLDTNREMFPLLLLIIHVYQG